MFSDPLFGHQGTQNVVLDEFEGVDLVRGAETVKEVDEGNPAAQRRGVGDEREVVGFLD